MKKSSIRKQKKKKFYINRLNKLMKQKQKRKLRKKANKSKNESNGNYFINNEYTDNKVITVLSRKKF